MAQLAFDMRILDLYLLDTTFSGYRLCMSLLYISLHVHTLLNCTYSNEDSR
jgi:hypothetical protein